MSSRHYDIVDAQLYGWRVLSAWFSFQSFFGRPAYNATVEISIL